MRPPRAISAMQASMAAAADEQVAQIVALVDTMQQRGVADGLVAPLRSRLARLRPPRQPSFARLLFTPLDPLVVPPATWRREMLSIPRSSLQPVADALRAVIAPESNQVDDEGRQGFIPPARMAELATSTWPRAASLLGTLGPPAAWEEATGLPLRDYAPTAAKMAAVLAVAAEIQVLTLSADAPAEDAIRTILGRSAPRGSVALGAVIAVLLSRLAGSGRIMALATEAAGSNPALAVDSAVDHTLDMLQASADKDSLISAGVAQATADATRLTGTLQEIEPSAATRPERKHRIDRVRRDADALCRARFEAALQDELIGKVSALPGVPDDAAVESLESNARALRRLEGVGRKLGGGERYDAVLRRSLAPFQLDESPLDIADRARIIEILAGAEKALALIKMPPL